MAANVGLPFGELALPQNPLDGLKGLFRGDGKRRERDRNGGEKKGIKETEGTGENTSKLRSCFLDKNRC